MPHQILPRPTPEPEPTGQPVPQPDAGSPPAEGSGADTQQKETGYQRKKRQLAVAQREMGQMKSEIAELKTMMQAFLQGQQAAPQQQQPKPQGYSVEELENYALSDNAFQENPQTALVALLKAQQARNEETKRWAEQEIAKAKKDALEAGRRERQEEQARNFAVQQIAGTFGADALNEDNDVFHEFSTLLAEQTQRYGSSPPPSNWLGLYWQAAANCGRIPQQGQPPPQQVPTETPAPEVPPPGGGIEGIGSGAADQSFVLRNSDKSTERHEKLKAIAERFFPSG